MSWTETDFKEMIRQLFLTFDKRLGVLWAKMKSKKYCFTTFRGLVWLAVISFPQNCTKLGTSTFFRRESARKYRESRLLIETAPSNFSESLVSLTKTIRFKF